MEQALDRASGRKVRAAKGKKSLAVGDRAFVSGHVLRVLPAERRAQLLIMIDASGFKLVLHSDNIAGGDQLHGGDPVTLIGTVTRIGEHALEGQAPVSLALDGYDRSRVTVPLRAVGRVT